MSDPSAEFLDSAVWHGSLDRADALLAAHPEIAASDIYSAALLGDDVAVRRFIEADAGNATAKGGPRGWDALTYLCFSKYLRLDPVRSESFVRAATALLDAGASASTGFYDSSHKPAPAFESALYGAAGVAHHPEMTRLLLDRGADPNDGEVPYHTPETLDNRAMKVLVESGKLTPESMLWLLNRKMNWHDDDGFAWLLDHGADPNLPSHLGRRPLHHALGHGNPISYFELLLDHGADPTLPATDGTTPFATAARMARADVLELFESRGFRVALHGDDAFLAACARADEAAARAFLAEDPGLIRRLESQNIGLLADFAGAGNTPALRLMLDLGFNIAASPTSPEWMRGETALHVAVGRGLVDNVRLLIARGAPLEASYRGDTALAVAIRCLEEQSEWSPNEHTVEIAAALIQAGAVVEPAKMTLAAAICLDRAEDIARLATGASAKNLQVALAAAAFHGDTRAIRTVIGLGAQVNAKNQGSYPQALPLHNAVCSGSLAAVQALIEAGAQVDASNTVNHATPLDWAEYFVREKRNAPKQYAEIVDYLRGIANSLPIQS